MASLTKNEFAHYIGELYGGGIVVSVWKDTSGAEHGLVASLKDLSTGTAWSNVTTTAIGATAQNFFNGKDNINAIIGQTGHSLSAAQLCDTFRGEGYNDWYLPSVSELIQCYNAFFIINMTLGSANSLKYINYWSSTEYGANQAHYMHFRNFYGINVKNTNTNGVRAFRKY